MIRHFVLFQPYSEQSKVFSTDEPKRGKDDDEQVENFQKRSIELQRQQYEDHLKHIQVCCTSGFVVIVVIRAIIFLV